MAEKAAGTEGAAAAAATEPATLLGDAKAGDAAADKGGADGKPAEAAGEKADGAGDKAGDDKGKDGEGKDKAKAEGAPEKYEAFTLPEGFEIDTEATEQFSGIAKELNLNQAQAQKLVSLYAERMAGMAQQQEARLNDLSKQWVDEIKADKELGGANFEANVKAGQRTVLALEKQIPGLRAFLNETRTGNHPIMFRLFQRLAKTFSEDAPVKADSGASSDRPLADRMYNPPAK